MRVDNASHSSQIHGMQRLSSSQVRSKGTAMLTLPYRTLMHQKRWATNGLSAVIAESLDRIADADRILIRRLLDHIQVVDEIFSHNLEALPHGHRAPRSAELPSFDALASKARASG